MNVNQWLLDALTATSKDGLMNRGRYRLLSAIRQARLWFSDPLVRFRLEQSTLLLPLSHELPLYRRALPEYASNLGRAVAIVQTKYRNLVMIDVGANVGDSAAIVRAYAQTPILCIEGEDRFFRLLLVNTRNLTGIELEHVFVGGGEDHVSALHVARGTASIKLGSDAGQWTTLTLEEVISHHPRFHKFKFLKLDAEGFDCKIISSESRFLALSRSVLFFEYHPPLSAAAGYDPFPVFAQLSEIGYRVVLIYENTGRYLLSVELGQRNVLEDIHYYFAKMGGFCDVIAFHAEDLDLAEEVRQSELGGQGSPSATISSVDMENCAHAD